MFGAMGLGLARRASSRKMTEIVPRNEERKGKPAGPQPESEAPARSPELVKNSCLTRQSRIRAISAQAS